MSDTLREALKEVRNAVIGAIQVGADASQIEDEVSEAFLIEEKGTTVIIYDDE